MKGATHLRANAGTADETTDQKASKRGVKWYRGIGEGGVTVTMPISRVNQPAHAGYICQHRHHRHRHRQRCEVRLTRADLELEVELEGSAWRGKYAVAATGNWVWQAGRGDKELGQA